MWHFTHIGRIRRSILAVLLLFVMGLAVLGASLSLFDTKLRDVTPQSMIEKKIDYNSDWLLPVLLVVIAGLGLPLGYHVVSTLAECEKKETQQLN